MRPESTVLVVFSRRNPGLDRKEEGRHRRSGNGNRSLMARVRDVHLKQSEDTPSSSSRHASTPLRAVQKADDDAIRFRVLFIASSGTRARARSVDKQRRHLWEILEERLRVVVVVVVVASRRRGKRRQFYGKRKEDCVSPSQTEGKGDLGENVSSLPRRRI